MTDSIGHKKRAMLEALEKSLGVVTTACKQAQISRDTHYRWLKEDKDYRVKCKDMENVALDFGAHSSAEDQDLSWHEDSANSLP